MARSIICRASSGLVANCRVLADPGGLAAVLVRRSTTPAGTAPGRSAPARRPEPRRPGTPRAGSSRSGPQSRSTAAARRPTSSPSSGTRSHRPPAPARASPSPRDHVSPQVIADLVRGPGVEVQQPLHPVRRRVPGELRDRPAVLPLRSATAAPADTPAPASATHACANRPAIRANTSSNPVRHAARSNLGGAATARSESPFTPRRPTRWPPSCHVATPGKITGCGCSTSRLGLDPERISRAPGGQLSEGADSIRVHVLGNWCHRDHLRS